MLTIAVLISGNGSNLQAIIDAIQQRYLNAKLSVVISNRVDAYGLERAHKANIPTEIVLHSAYPDRSSYERALLALLDTYQVDIIVLAGFMRILSAEFIHHYPGRIVNIHPSLLPKYPGLHTHRRVLEAGDKEHGTTIHFVDENLDGGPVILQAKLAVLTTDTEESLRLRVQQVEHQVYPLVLQWLAEHKLIYSPNGICLDKQLLPPTGYSYTPSSFAK